MLNNISYHSANIHTLSPYDSLAVTNKQILLQNFPNSDIYVFTDYEIVLTTYICVTYFVVKPVAVAVTVSSFYRVTLF